jgi:hypothetical protein
MSAYQDRVLTCPHCDHGAVESVALMLEATRAHGERQAILDSTFQRFECESCHRTYRAEGPLMYLDFDDKLWIGVFPTPWEATWWKHEREPAAAFQRNMQEHCPPMVRDWAPGFSVRAVFGLDGLREKLVAHAAGIDDRLLEAYKLDLLRGMGPYELSARARPRLREVDGTHAFFDVPRPEPDDPHRRAVVKVGREELRRMHEHREDWAAVVAALSAGPYVDLGRIFIPRGDADRPAQV